MASRTIYRAAADAAATPTLEDAEAVHAVLRARDIADIGRPDFSLEDVLTDWQMPGIDPAVDCFVAEEDGTIAGYALVDRRGAVVSVHPDFEGRGIGTALREAAERRLAERGQTITQGIVTANTGAVEHLRAAGYERKRIYQRLRAPLAAWRRRTDGVAVRRFDLDAEGEAVHELIEARLHRDRGQRPRALRGVDRVGAAPHRAAVPARDRRRGRRGRGDRRRALGGRRRATWRRSPPRGGSRGRGYGRALLLALAEAFRADGLETLELSVHGSNAPALGLYQGIGMTPDFRAERWERRSTASAPSMTGRWLSEAARRPTSC